MWNERGQMLKMDSEGGKTTREHIVNISSCLATAVHQHISEDYPSMCLLLMLPLVSKKDGCILV